MKILKFGSRISRALHARAKGCRISRSALVLISSAMLQAAEFAVGGRQAIVHAMLNRRQGTQSLGFAFPHVFDVPLVLHEDIV